MKTCPCCKVPIISARLKAVARLVLQGHGPNSIAYQLDVTFNTVHIHMHNLYNMTGMDNMLELAMFFIRNKEWLHAIYEVPL